MKQGDKIKIISDLLSTLNTWRNLQSIIVAESYNGIAAVAWRILYNILFRTVIFIGAIAAAMWALVLYPLIIKRFFSIKSENSNKLENADWIIRHSFTNNIIFLCIVHKTAALNLLKKHLYKTAVFWYNDDALMSMIILEEI